MRILLDTHLLLWWLEASPSLSTQAREMICDPQNTVFVSAVSLWEIWLKQSLGKLRLPGDFTERLAAESFENLPLMASHPSRSLCFRGVIAILLIGCSSHKRR